MDNSDGGLLLIEKLEKHSGVIETWLNVTLIPDSIPDKTPPAHIADLRPEDAKTSSDYERIPNAPCSSSMNRNAGRSAL